MCKYCLPKLKLECNRECCKNSEKEFFALDRINGINMV